MTQVAGFSCNSADSNQIFPKKSTLFQIFLAKFGKMNGNRRKKKRGSKARPDSIASTTSTTELKEEVNEVDNSVVNFTVNSSEVMGRFMVAARNFTPGMIVLSEYPLIVGPCTGCKVQCLGCYQNLEESDEYTKCASCGWPMCNPSCPGLGKPYGHTQEECKILTETKSGSLLDYKDFAKLRTHLYTIAPLRCLLLKETNKKSYETVMSMEPHNEYRKKIPDIWDLNQKTVVDRIRKKWKLMQFSEEEIHTVCGILEVNAFEIGQNGINIRGIYPTAFLMSHDCIPNTNHTDEEDYKLTIRASVPIDKNGPITLSYAHTLQNTLKRREHLLENKFFECKCKRCLDPTELGTYMGALRCPKCKIGWVLSSDPANPEAQWICNNKVSKRAIRCPGYTVGVKSIRLLLDRITEDFETIDSNNIKGFEQFLEKYKNVLHPSHYLCLGVKLSLSQLYGKITGYIINEMSDELLIRKRDLCKEILKVIDIIEPGYTRLRGVTLYELHAPIMILITRAFEMESLSKSELRRKLREVVNYLEEANIILGFEPRSSSEGIMGVAAKDSLVKIREWEKIIGKI